MAGSGGFKKLVQQIFIMKATYIIKKNGKYSWSDTRKHARIRKRIGEPVSIDLSQIDPSWRNNPSGLATVNKPYRAGLPRGTEVSFYILESETMLNASRTCIKVQYVEARR